MSSLPRRRMRAPPCRCCRAAAIGTSPEGRGGQAVVKQPGRAHILAMTRQDIIPSNSDAQAPGALERNRARVERGFWTKLKRSVGRVPFLEDAVSAYYAAFDPQTPRSVKAMLLAALAYFVVPSDLVPDFIAGLGFTDDATVLFTTIRLVAGHIGERHHEQARQRLQLLGLLDDATPAMASGPRSGPGEGS